MCRAAGICAAFLHAVNEHADVTRGAVVSGGATFPAEGIAFPHCTAAPTGRTGATRTTGFAWVGAVGASTKRLVGFTAPAGAAPVTGGTAAHGI